jgi:hypothetical protein
VEPEGISVNEPWTTVDAEKPPALPLTIAILLAVLRYYRDAATKSGEDRSETAVRLMSPGSE